MSIALFFITHEGIASNLLKVSEDIIQQSPDNLAFIEVPMDAPVDDILLDAENRMQQLSSKDGVFFITDIFGSTPSNIAQQLAEKHHGVLLCGVNLPMIIRLLNYREVTASELLEKALDGAQKGIRYDMPKGDD